MASSVVYRPKWTHNKEEIENDLTKVVTIKEASLIWGLSTSGIRHHVMRGKIPCRVSGGVYLLLVSDCVNILGKAKNPTQPYLTWID